jgi:hypothetical protein
VKQPRISKSDSDRFGRQLVILLTRATMYKPGHPYVKQSADILYQLVVKLFGTVSPLVFSMHREQCFVDDQPLETRGNVSRVISHFRKVGLESISFYEGITETEVESLLKLYVFAPNHPDVGSMNRTLVEDGVKHIKLNHVMFRKITADEAVISRDASEVIGLQTVNEDPDKSRKALYDLLLESALTVELQQGLTIDSLLQNPTQALTNMIQLDLKSCHQSDAGDRSPGLVLLSQLQALGGELEQGFKRKDSPELSRLAGAVFALKRQLLEAMEAQKALDVAYANEESIRSEATEIADKVLLRLVREEYKGGKISAARLAQTLRRLIPETAELKRVLPKIKRALLEEGMPAEEFWKLMREIGKELESDDLATVLQETSRKAGVESRELIQEIKRNPVQVAELICLAAEVQKATGDEKVLVEVLVDYVERLAPQLALDTLSRHNKDADSHLRKVISELEVNIGARLRDMHAGGDLLVQVEERINERLEVIVRRFKDDLFRPRPVAPPKASPTNLNLLNMLEQTVSGNAELREALSTVRAKFEAERIDPNDFGRIHTEILDQMQKRRRRRPKGKTRPGLLQPQGVMYLIEKEIARAKRYKVPFSILCFSTVTRQPHGLQPEGAMAPHDLIEAILNKLAIILRDADELGHLEKGTMVALLPMTASKQAKSVLRRCLKVLNSEPVSVDGVPASPNITGIAHGFDPSMRLDVNAFVKAALHELEHTIARVKNLGTFF